MRIIAGTKRGMKLLSPKGRISRPITDRVKESLFSVLFKYNMPAGAVVADIFCGVGSLGLEAISRSARFVTFVEQDPAIAAILEKNIAKSGYVEQSKVAMINAFTSAVPNAPKNNEYNLVFIDPPYAETKDVSKESKLGKLLNLLGEKVSDNGIVVVRTHESSSISEQYGVFKVVERRKWGTMAVAILTRADI